ncbi:MAG TPA: leishmanolysin-related zinc metalloendopeptidase [Gemmatimonadales bacterium]
MRRPRLGAALIAVTLAACVDSQAPDNSPSTTAPTSKTSLPVLPTMQVTANAANGYTITLRFINAPTTAQRAFFETAAARWEGIITGDVPNTTGTIPARSCGNSFRTPSFNGEVDDVLIDVLLQPIDGPGAVLGAAGPCLVRSADFLTLYGLMFFDTADLDFLAQFGIFDEVVVHEMGHVLGIGTLWNFGRSLLQGANTQDPRFVGPMAIAGYLDVGGRGNSVPVEEGFGPGTRLSHWDEETFDKELMTGFIGTKGAPLSVMTIGSMGDLGYQVSAATADKYQVSGRQERTAGDPAAADPVDLGRREKLITPLAVVE